MAKLIRKTQKIFAGNADSDQITAFATAKTSSPVYTTDIDAIQTTAFTQGWTPSLMSDLAPYLQDSNGLWYAITRQLAYLYQQGIAEWDSNTTYYTGSKVSDGSKIYVSKTDNNIGNALTETMYWDVYDLNVTDSLNSKLNIDLSNATSTTKSTIINLNAPDYTAGITTNISRGATITYTCPNNGIIVTQLEVSYSGNALLKINNTTIYDIPYNSATEDTKVITGEFAVLSGDVVTAKDNWTAGKITFYPYKGV